MASIPINIGGGGASLEPTGSASKPIYIDSNGEAQACSTVENINTTVRNSNVIYFTGSLYNSNTTGDTLYKNTNVYVTTNNVLRGACWNDVAETRRSDCTVPGSCVKETKDGILTISKKRLEKGCSIISDTYGFLIGEEEDKNYAPTAIAGRVLAKRDFSHFEVGDPVCSGPNGTVSKMNRIECILFPDRIIGFVSEIPDQFFWNTTEVKDRIWIRVK